MSRSIAEAIGHDESAFADMMTRKARALGMSNTTYRNASGLPNDQQITTARDLTILARSLEDRFPRYFKYFATGSFAYDGETIGNHNHLLGRVDGVDGIKTGYTRASGFNLLTSVHRDGRSLIAVVMGGRTAGARDRAMESLIEDHLAQASTVRTATMVADASAPEEAPAPAPTARSRPMAVAASVPARLPAARALPDEGQGDNAEADDQPLTVAAVRPVATPRPSDLAHAAPQPVARSSEAKSVADDPPLAGKITLRATDPPAPIPPAKPRAETDGRVADESPETVAPASVHDGAESGKDWKIQIGATDDPAKATALLDRARDRDRAVLAAAKPITETVRKGEDTFYRARFAGLEQASAVEACRSLKRSGFSCFATRD